MRCSNTVLERQERRGRNSDAQIPIRACTAGFADPSPGDLAHGAMEMDCKRTSAYEETKRTTPYFVMPQGIHGVIEQETKEMIQCTSTECKNAKLWELAFLTAACPLRKKCEEGGGKKEMERKQGRGSMSAAGALREAYTGKGPTVMNYPGVTEIMSKRTGESIWLGVGSEFTKVRTRFIDPQETGEAELVREEFSGKSGGSSSLHRDGGGKKCCGCVHLRINPLCFPPPRFSLCSRWHSANPSQDVWLSTQTAHWLTLISLDAVPVNTGTIDASSRQMQIAPRMLRVQPVVSHRTPPWLVYIYLGRKHHGSLSSSGGHPRPGICYAVDDISGPTGRLKSLFSPNRPVSCQFLRQFSLLSGMRDAEHYANRIGSLRPRSPSLNSLADNWHVQLVTPARHSFTYCKDLGPRCVVAGSTSSYIRTSDPAMFALARGPIEIPWCSIISICPQSFAEVGPIRASISL
ncbi:hypothetical protein B0H13DRAFT_1852222 [Mycena leptocephala]|nr:hypothetical protein B0H13DRAFT_1852222 [Mycena leptocephala]